MGFKKGVQQPEQIQDTPGGQHYEQLFKKDETMSKPTLKSNTVLVLNSPKNPLIPTTLSKAPSLLKVGKASIFRRSPFSIILNKGIEKVEDQPFKNPGIEADSVRYSQLSNILYSTTDTHSNNGARFPTGYTDG